MVEVILVLLFLLYGLYVMIKDEAHQREQREITNLRLSAGEVKIYKLTLIDTSDITKIPVGGDETHLVVLDSSIDGNDLKSIEAFLKKKNPMIRITTEERQTDYERHYWWW